MGICRDVLTIVEDNEGVPDDGAIEGDSRGCEQEAKSDVKLLACKDGCGSRWSFRVRLLNTANTCFGERTATSHASP